MPSAATPIEGKLAGAAGTKLVHTGGYVTGASRAITEPLGTGPSPAKALVAAVIANNAGATLVNFISVALKVVGSTLWGDGCRRFTAAELDRSRDRYGQALTKLLRSSHETMTLI